LAGGARSPWFELHCQFDCGLAAFMACPGAGLADWFGHLALVAGYLPRGGTSDILVGRRRSISWPVATEVTQRLAHGSRSGSPADRRRSIHDDGVAACWQ